MQTEQDMSNAKNQSLFERITGSMQQHIDSFRDDGEMVRSKPLTGEKLVDSPAQGSLDIETPAAKPAVKIDDELDIPAFLRRQAN